MRKAKVILMAMLIAFVTVTLAHAGTQVQVNQAATVKASVKNLTTRSVPAAVKMTAYDDANMKIGQVCKQAYLGAGRTTDVYYTWNAPSYATGVYWQAKVEKYGVCPSTTVTTYYHDDDEHDDDDHDDEHDDDDGDYHH